jgi:hypothetical protein
LALDQLRGGNNENIITPMLTTAFEEKRYIEHDNRLAARASKSKKTLFTRFYNRVNNALEPRERLGISEDALAEKRAVNPTLYRTNAGKRRRDRFHGGAPRRQQLMNDTIGIEQRDLEPLQRRRCGALTHAD